MKITTAALLLTASLAAPAIAHADCGDPGQHPCTRPVPTVDQGLAVMAKFTDPSRPAPTKNDAITAGFTTKDDPPPSPVEPLPMPLPFGSQNVPPGVEVYCPNAVWVLRRCHQCEADPAHKCWDR
jgi:hypothetical protein